jgi:2-polyprenyl-3-methyl-5-hydroxy-6-metoxy-1,4-benzoquinol methylase
MNAESRAGSGFSVIDPPEDGAPGLVLKPGFERVARCWVCGGVRLSRYYECRMDISEYVEQDPELHQYTGQHVWLVRCAGCGFGQPEALPTLPNFFDRMYDQRWSDAWVQQEFSATYKDLIFDAILNELANRIPPARHRLLDVGAHAGRFMHLAQVRGWTVEGIELNPRTAAYAQAHTGAHVHRVNAHTLALDGHRYDAVVLTDVLEHIPEPTRLLAALAALLEPGGIVAIKVPNGSAQWIKERWLARLTAHRMSLAENLVHVNQFTPRSLVRAVRDAGFRRVQVSAAAPELPAGNGVRGMLDGAVRRAMFAAASFPGAVHTPLALHLQAYGTKGQQ